MAGSLLLDGYTAGRIRSIIHIYTVGSIKEINHDSNENVQK
jgi:hypothetical protein